MLLFNKLVDKFKGLNRKRLIGFFLPFRIDEFLYEISLAPDRQRKSFSEIPLEIKKTFLDAGIRYEAFSEGRFVHKTELRTDVFRAVQFGFEDYPVLGNSETVKAFRGKGIYPHVLAWIIADRAMEKANSKIFILVSVGNTPSIRGIEKAGFSLRARLKGLRWGPFVFRDKKEKG